MTPLKVYGPALQLDIEVACVDTRDGCGVWDKIRPANGAITSKATENVRTEPTVRDSRAKASDKQSLLIDLDYCAALDSPIVSSQR
jgi:hypothetical protein